MRPTSVEAYHAIVATGVLGKLQLAVYTLLFERGPLTGREVNVSVRDGHKRLSELESLGVVASGVQRECSVSGRQAIEWATTTSHVVVPIADRRSRLKQYRELVVKVADWLECCGQLAEAERLRKRVREIEAQT